MKRVLLLILCIIGYAQAVCELPINFTYFQQPFGSWCLGPNAHLASTYGGSFSSDTNGVARETNDPNVRFTIIEVEKALWDELIARLNELEPGVAKGGIHTPSLFWDGRYDVYWHANDEEDTISTEFKNYVDSHINICLASSSAMSTTTPATSITGSSSSTAATNEPTSSGDNGEDGCALNNTVPPSGDVPFDTTNQTLTSGDESILCFVFFFSRGCPHCAAVKDYIKGNLQKRADVTFRYEAYDVYESDYSRRLIAGYNYFGWDGAHAVPAVFIGEEDDMSVLVGEKVIRHQLLPCIQELQSEPPPCFDFAALLSENPELADENSNLHWGVLTAAALVDSINPCAIAVLLILLGGLTQSIVPSDPAATAEQVHPDPAQSAPTAPPLMAIPVQVDGPYILDGTKEETGEEEASAENIPETQASRVDEEMVIPSSLEVEGETSPTTTSPNEPQDSEARDKERKSRSRRAFFSGMAFISSVFISYYLLGFGIFSAVSSTQASSKILLALGIFIIFLGAWNLKDFFCYDKGYNVEIPHSWRPLLKRVLGAVSSPLGAFAAGFLVCLFELPCTGGPYLFILGLLADKKTRTEAAFLLLYYNFIFVLPLIIINCLVCCGAAWLEKVGSWKEKYIRHLHLFAGLVLITLGVLAVVDYWVGLF